MKVTDIDELEKMLCMGDGCGHYIVDHFVGDGYACHSPGCDCKGPVTHVIISATYDGSHDPPMRLIYEDVPMDLTEIPSEARVVH